MKELTTKIPFRHLSQFLEKIANEKLYDKKRKLAEKFFAELNKYKKLFIDENGTNCVSFANIFVNDIFIRFFLVELFTVPYH